MVKYEPLNIKGKRLDIPIFQGGMGVAVSRWLLAGSVAQEGGVGIISTAGLDRIVSKETGKEFNTYEAVAYEVARAKEFGDNGLIGVNIMVFLQKDRDSAARGAIAAGADFIISGAGIPLDLPTIKDPGDTALIPIVSSPRVLKIILEKWERLGCRPDAIVVEGPLAGGHLGFKLSELEKPENRLESLLRPIKDLARQHGNFPVIVAGGIYDKHDIQRLINLGADGVQMGTRFLATKESGASKAYKKAVVESKKDEIIVVRNSPCGFPFRTLSTSPVYQDLINNRGRNTCDKGYLLQRDNEGNNTVCLAKNNPKDYFCICNGLLNSVGYQTGQNLYTVGANAYRIKKILTVKELMNELKGLT